MRNWTKATIIFLSFIALNAHARILIDETAPPGEEMRNVAHYDDATDFKARKKVAVSSTIAGAMGFIGVSLNFNFTPDTAFAIGTGTSTGFNAFNMNFKVDLGDGAFQPYFVGGYSRWFSNGSHGSVNHTMPSFFSSKFLTAGERKTGVFAKNLIYPGIGLQYTNLDGELQGLGYFAEAIMMMDLSSLGVQPTGGLGAIYYF